LHSGRHYRSTRRRFIVTLALSDALSAELQAADIVVIGAPMYNFSIASRLRACAPAPLAPPVRVDR